MFVATDVNALTRIEVSGDERTKSCLVSGKAQ